MRKHLCRAIPLVLIAALASCQAPAAKNAPAKPKKTTSATAKQPAPKPPVKTVLPKLADLGSTTCVPCKMMTPILEELTKDYRGRLKVEFIDVGKDPDAARRHAIRVIPTQVFFDAEGKEFFRHEGFYAKEDILRKFKDQGIKLEKTPPTPPAKKSPEPAKKTGATRKAT